MSTTDEPDSGPLRVHLSGRLGPLPPPERLGTHYPRGLPEPLLAYSAEQMRAYAAQQVSAERERCAKLCEEQDPYDDYGMRSLLETLSDKIRA